MYTIKDEEIDFILKDLKANGVVIEDLQYNLLDHICCVLEDEMPHNGDFYEFYAKVLPRFFKRDLKELQHETEDLLKFKHYYAMKTTLKITGIFTAILMLLGAIFKTCHLPGAGAMIVFSGLTFSLIFLPLMIILKFRDDETVVDKMVFTIGLLIGIGTTAGVMFKLMHWPYANFIMRWSGTFFIFCYVPLYLGTRLKRADQRFNTIVNTVLMMAFGGMLYSLYDLGNSKSVNNSILSAYEFMLNNTEQVSEANSKLAGGKTGAVTSLRAATQKLYIKIDSIKVHLIAESMDITTTEAAKISMSDVTPGPDYTDIRNRFESGSGSLTLTSLNSAVDDYNRYVSTQFPGQSEKLISIQKLQLDNTVLQILLFELSQIQNHLLMTENSGLNYLVSLE